MNLIKKRIIIPLIIIVSALLSAYCIYKSRIIYGIASWYGEYFKGKPTASGEIFDPENMTAAHKTLPLGTIIRVENLENGKKVDLKVNDRGPYIIGRTLDVSRRAARELGFKKKGLTQVKITILYYPEKPR